MDIEGTLHHEPMHCALYQRVRGQIAGVLGRDEFFEDGRIGHQPAQTQTGGDQLRECAKVEHVAGVIFGFERRRRQPIAVQVDEAGRIVLHDRQVMARGDAQ